MCVPFTGSEAWTRSIGYNILDEWRPWIVNEQVAGYESFSEILFTTKMVIALQYFIFCSSIDLVMNEFIRN